MCVQHPHELALVPCPLFTWTRRPQKAEPTMRVCVQVVILTSDSREQEWELKEGKQRRWESQPKECHKLVLLWTVGSGLVEPSVELSRMCLRVVHPKRESLSGRFTTFALLAWLRLQNG